MFNCFSFYSTAFFIPFTEISLHGTQEENDVMEVEGLLASVPPVVNGGMANQSNTVGVSLLPAVAQTPLPQSSSEDVVEPSVDTAVGIPQVSDISFLAPTHTLEGVLENNDITNSIVISNSNLVSDNEKECVQVALPESNGCIVPSSTVMSSNIDSSEQIHVSQTVVSNDESLPPSATSFEIFDDPDTRGMESGKQISDILRLLSASGQIQGIQLTASVTNETNPSSTNVFEASGVRAAEILRFLSASGQIQDIQLASSIETGNSPENLSETTNKTSGNILYLTSPSLSNANLSNDLTPFISSSTMDSNQIESMPNVIEMRNSRIVLHVQDAPVTLDSDKSQEALDNTINMVSPSILLPSRTTVGSSELSSSWISGIDCSQSSHSAAGTLPLVKDYEENTWSSFQNNVPMLHQSDLNLVTPSSHVFTAPSTKDPHGYTKGKEMRNVLKDITSDADICKCNPCRCDASQQECQRCNTDTETLNVSDIPEVSSISSSSSSDNDTRKGNKNDVLHEQELGALQVNAQSSVNDLCMTAESGNSCSDNFSPYEHRIATGSDTDKSNAHDTVRTQTGPSYDGTGDLIEITDSITLTESSTTNSAQTNHSYDSTNLDSWQNTGCSADTLIVPHVLPLNETQNQTHSAAGNSENNNVAVGGRICGSCECCGKNSNKTSHSEVQSNNNGTHSREPCCVVVCLRTLEQLRRLIDKGCCSGAENSLRALALQVSSVKSSCCSGRHK
jgi:hypothetical protein